LEQMLQNYSRHSTEERYLWIDVQGTSTGGNLYGFEAKMPPDAKFRELRFLPTSPDPFSYEFKWQAEFSIRAG
jgi:hypothetical protein